MRADRCKTGQRGEAIFNGSLAISYATRGDVVQSKKYLELAQIESEKKEPRTIEDEFPPDEFAYIKVDL